GIRDKLVTGVQTCALPIFPATRTDRRLWRGNDGCKGRRYVREQPTATLTPLRSSMTASLAPAIPSGGADRRRCTRLARAPTQRRSEERRVGNARSSAWWAL